MMLCTDFCCKLNNTKSVALSKTAQFVIPITSMVKHGIFACYNDSSTSLCYFLMRFKRKSLSMAK